MKYPNFLYWSFLKFLNHPNTPAHSYGPPYKGENIPPEKLNKTSIYWSFLKNPVFINIFNPSSSPYQGRTPTSPEKLNKTSMSTKSHSYKQANGIKKTRVLMALAPSGGHIYPALAIIEKLEALDSQFINNLLSPINPTNNTKPKSQNSTKSNTNPSSTAKAGIQKIPLDTNNHEDNNIPSWEFYILYNKTPLSQKILQDCPYPCYAVSLGGMAKGQKFFNKIKTLLQLPVLFFKSLWLIYKLKIDIVFGTGGSVTVPVLMAGFFMRKKRAIWEGNASMGLANRFLAPFVSYIFTVFPKVKGLNDPPSSDKREPTYFPPDKRNQHFPLNKRNQHFPPDKGGQGGSKKNLKSQKAVVSAYPLRQKVRQSFNHSPKKEIFPKEDFKVLVLGGSQGSVFLNQVVSQALQDDSWRTDIFIYHQTGERSFKEIQKKYQLFKRVKAFSFIHNIQDYYTNCDLIFSRAGAGAISEMAFFAKALVLIPLSRSAGGHQKDNALSLSIKNCTQTIEEKDFSPHQFKNTILELKKDPNNRKSLGNNLKKHFPTEDRISPWFLKNFSKKS